MTAFALLLVLLAAVLHAMWNFCAKRSGGGVPFVFVVGVVICACYIPVLAVYLSTTDQTLPDGALLWIIGSGALKTGYTLFLQRSYRHGDFSLVYPVARGTGPFLSTVAAILILGERPTPLALAGGLIIIASIFWLTGGFARIASIFLNTRASSRPQIAAPPDTHLLASINYGLLSGVFIATYTIWDRHGVAALAIHPVLYDGGTAFIQLAFLMPLAIRRWPEVAEEWRTKKRWIFGVALLSPIAYILVLTAMTFTPVSYVAPAREVSIVIGAFLGAKYLNEAHGRRRILAALAMALGVIALAIA
jgi:drug/metabolite transporter (DMT)-like permease